MDATGPDVPTDVFAGVDLVGAERGETLDDGALDDGALDDELVAARAVCGIPQIVALANAKGGAGKTSVTVGVGGLAALGGWRVLIIDLDHQDNVGLDLGYSPSPDTPELVAAAHHALGYDLSAHHRAFDNGEGMTLAIAAAARGESFEPPAILRDVRSDLDVIPGGSDLEELDLLPADIDPRSVGARSALARVIASVVGDYDLVLIDCPPGSPFRQWLALAAARFVVIPVMSDTASTKGMTLVAQRFQDVADINPALELLGVVVFGVDSRTTRVERRVRHLVAQAIGAAPVFDTTIRGYRTVADACRDRGIVVQDYESLCDVEPGRHPYVASAHRLADDYERLSRELFVRMRDRLVASKSQVTSTVEASGWAHETV